MKIFVAMMLLALPALGGSIPGLTTSQINYSGVVIDATAGPDGSTWFIDRVNDALGRTTTPTAV